MKWDTIKDRCVREAHSQFFNGNGATLSLVNLACMLDPTYKNKYEGIGGFGHSVRLELYKEVEKTIDAWDIRCHGTLKKVFPKAFPSGANTPNLGENGWEMI